MWLLGKLVCMHCFACCHPVFEPIRNALNSNICLYLTSHKAPPISWDLGKTALVSPMRGWKKAENSAIGLEDSWSAVRYEWLLSLRTETPLASVRTPRPLPHKGCYPLGLQIGKMDVHIVGFLWTARNLLSILIINKWRM